MKIVAYLDNDQWPKRALNTVVADDLVVVGFGDTNQKIMIEIWKLPFNTAGKGISDGMKRK